MRSTLSVKTFPVSIDDILPIFSHFSQNITVSPLYSILSFWSFDLWHSITISYLICLWSHNTWKIKGLFFWVFWYPLWFFRCFWYCVNKDWVEIAAFFSNKMTCCSMDFNSFNIVLRYSKIYTYIVLYI